MSNWGRFFLRHFYVKFVILKNINIKVKFLLFLLTIGLYIKMSQKETSPIGHLKKGLPMEIIRIVGIGLIALIIIILLKQYKPEFAIYISLLTGALILLLLTDQLSGIVDLIQSIAGKANINSQFLSLLIKITGIAFLSEFAVSICRDSGEGAIATKIELGSKIIIISMSIPIISSLLEIILQVLP